MTVATCKAEPLLAPLVVMTAVKFPAVVGLVEKLIVSDVGEAAVTDPTAPLFKTTTLFASTALKPNPRMSRLVALPERLVVLLVTTGVTVATCAADPLPTLLAVTIAVKAPAVVGFVEKVTVSRFAVAVETVPTAPLLKTTVLFPAVISKPKPLMVAVVAFAATLDVLLVTTGITVAT